MKILFVGSVLPAEYEIKLKYLSSAGNHFQNNIIEAFMETQEVDVLSYIGYFTEEIIKDNNCVTQEKGKIKSIIIFQQRLRKKVKQADLIISYNIIYPWLNLGKIANRMNKKSILILADYSPSESYSSIVHKLYAKIQERSIKRYSLVVGLSENVKKHLVKGQDFFCMEGGIKLQLYEDFKLQEWEEGSTLKIMYAGLLSKVTGVDLLLESFSKIKNDNIELHITGKGDLEELLINYVKKDSRIIYHGYVEYKEYLKILQRMHILVNPRNMTLPENQNNFPSKVLEYLATGKIIVSTKFIGWEKFKENIYFTESTVEGLFNTLRKAVKEYILGFEQVYIDNRKMAESFEWRNQVNKILKRMQ